MAERSEHTGTTRSKRTADKDIGETLQTAKEQAKEAAAEKLDEMKAQAGEAGRAAQREVGRLAEQMRESAESLFREQKDRLAETVHGFADALRRAADALEREDKAVVARYAEQAATQMDRLSTTMRERNLQEMMAAGEDFARRQPAIFIAGAVAAGVVLGRLLARPAAERHASQASAYAVTAGEGGYHAGQTPATHTPASEPMAGYASADTIRQP